MSTFPGAFVPVAPSADGLRLAFVAARRRRNTKAGASGAAGLLALMLVLASTGGGGDRTLLQEPLPPATTSGGSLGIVGGTEPSTAASPPPAAAANAAPVTGQRSLAAGGLTPATGPVAPSDPSAGGSSSGRVQAESTGPITSPMTRNYSWGYTNGDLVCPARKQQEGARFCVAVQAFSSGGTTTLSADICNVSTTAEVLSYETAREIDISLRQAGEDVWRWSAGRHFADTAHSVALPVGECLTWSTPWREVDAKGAPVPAGNYSVVAEFDAQQLPTADRRATYALTVSRP
ncbi:MAG: hypothetical protein JJD92_10835 [Frankiaceae bacterium]|nr:hypothetical protein [Frankiaceae bacterium]